MNGAEHNRHVGSDDDSGKDSDEEEISKAKEKFEDFFKRTKKYWISFASERLSRKEVESGVSVEEYALVLAEEEFMKETIPPSSSDLTNGRGAVGAANRRSRHGLPTVEANSNQAVQPQSQRQAANAPLQHQVNQLQHQLQRVDLDEGIE